MPTKTAGNYWLCSLPTLQELLPIDTEASSLLIILPTLLVIPLTSPVGIAFLRHAFAMITNHAPHLTLLALLIALAQASKTYNVDVGKNGNLTFVPDVLRALAGDVINFHFWPNNHSVVQSTFGSPCEPLSGGVGQTPIYSGYVPSDSGEAPTMFSMPVNNTDPIWLYCSQPMANHCEAGMSMVVNPVYVFPSYGSSGVSS